MVCVYIVVVVVFYRMLPNSTLAQKTISRRVQAGEELRQSSIMLVVDCIVFVHYTKDLHRS